MDEEVEETFEEVERFREWCLAPSDGGPAAPPAQAGGAAAEPPPATPPVQAGGVAPSPAIATPPARAGGGTPPVAPAAAAAPLALAGGPSKWGRFLLPAGSRELLEDLGLPLDGDYDFLYPEDCARARA